MKKALPIIILLFSIYNAESQVSKLELGIEGGPNISTVINSGITTVGFNGGYVAGITCMYKINDLVSIKTGLDYDVTGFTNTVTFTSNDGNTLMIENMTHTLNYLVLPVVVRASFGDNVRFFMNAGPYFGYLMSANGYSPGIGTIPSTNVNESTDFKRLDIGLTGGFGIGFPLKKGIILGLEARGNLGGLSIANNNVISNGVSIENVSGGLLLGLRYTIH